MASIITLTGEKLFAQKAQANEQLDIDTFIFANVTGQNAADPIDRSEIIPTADIVHQQTVQQVGRINDNVVVYSTVLDSVTGSFDFNWVGLYSSVNDTLVAINHIPSTAKTITEPGIAGNTLNRNFGIEYSGIAELTGINVAPETWQLDYTARLAGMDLLTQQLAKDLNGENAFIDDGFKVYARPTVNTFGVLPGAAYVNGLRVELETEAILIANSYPKNIYIDAYFDGDASSTWKPQHTVSITNDELTNYTDVNGKQHYLAKLAVVTAFNEVEDLRILFNEQQNSYTRNFETVAKAKDDRFLRVGQKITIEERANAPFTVIEETVNNELDTIECIGVLGASISLDKKNVMTPIMYGYDLNANNMTDKEIVAANWSVMKYFINDVKSNNLKTVNYNVRLTLRKIFANWLSGIKTPMGDYTDSTGDAAKTTDHIPSTSSDESPFSVTINESPNSYAKVLENLANNIGPAKMLATTYNGGFDSESYRSGFGLMHWYNTWFRGVAGSNVDWTDVSAIVLGFGVSDSANIDNTQEVIENYGIDLECTIIDCFLRGVQPILQTPVATVQHYGNTLDARNANQSLTIINAVQDHLKQKYKLEQLEYGATQLKALNAFKSLQYGDIISATATDQVHSLNLGHRINAGYRLNEMNDRVIKASNEQLNIFAGSPYYKVENESVNITSDVLTRAVTEQGAAVEKISEYFYKFPDSTASEKLLELDVYCEQPTTLFYMPIDTSVEQPSFLINHFTHNDNAAIAAQAAFEQPVPITYTKAYQIANLTFGLNRIFIYANSLGGEQKIGGMMTVPTSKIKGSSLYRETQNDTVKLMHSINFRDNNQSSAGAQSLNSLTPVWAQYMPQDNSYLTISFALNKNLLAATDHEIHSHFSDHLSKGTSFNKFVINDDTLKVFKVVNGITTEVASVTEAGLLAAMVAGAHVIIKIRTRFYLPNETQIKIQVNGVNKADTTVPIGDMWTTGYGLEMNNIQCRNVSINSIEALKGNNSNIN